MGVNIRRAIFYLCWCLGVALGYFLIGKFAVFISAANVAVIWPSAGLALWALLFKGWRLFPGVLLGSLVSNLDKGVDFLCPLGIGFGSSFAALTGWFLLMRVRHQQMNAGALTPLNNFILFGCAIPGLVSAAIGNISLLGFGVIDQQAFWGSFGNWWFSDATGALILGWVLVLVLPPEFGPQPTNKMGNTIIRGSDN